LPLNFTIAGDPEIVKFRGNPNSYLNDLGYRKWTGVDDGDGNPQTQPIPANIKIITLFEDENTLYSVIPWSGDLPADMSKQPPPEPEWWSFYSSLARYFMRHCR